jgi:anti-sigma factor RsiW
VGGGAHGASPRVVAPRPAIRRPRDGRGGVLLVVVPLASQQGLRHATDGSSAMVTEAVTDHLRVLSSQHPLDVESGGIHQVRPWFAGRLDFAPEVPFVGDEDFPLRGGAIGYFLDRKAAVFVYGHRMHTISLFVFRPEEFAWPTRRLRPRAGAAPTRRPRGGSPCSLWRAGELGYALVSDVDPPELFGLAIKLLGEA